MQPDSFGEEVERMLSDINNEVKLTRNLIGKDKLDSMVMAAMRAVPRHAFVPDSLAFAAYDNGPLSIGQGQTISQPYIVALMTDLLALTAHSQVLEIGTGSGYQSAVLSKIANIVYTIEIIGDLGELATQRFTRLGYYNIKTKIGDGYFGWQEHAPYDGIIVTAGAKEIPQALIEQLKVSGRLVIPLGDLRYGQTLTLVTKESDDEIKIQDILAVRFVPFTRSTI